MNAAKRVVWSCLDDLPDDAIQGPTVILSGRAYDPDFRRVCNLASRHACEALAMLGVDADCLTGDEIVRQLTDQFAAIMDDGSTYTPERLESHCAVYRRAATWAVELQSGKRVEHAMAGESSR